MHKMQGLFAYFYEYLHRPCGGKLFLIFLFRLSRFSRLLAKEGDSLPNVMDIPASVPHNSVPEGGEGICFRFV